MRSILSFLLISPFIAFSQNPEAEEEGRLFSEWFQSLTVSGFVTACLLASFTLLIIWMVIRTFRGKAEV